MRAVFFDYLLCCIRVALREKMLLLNATRTLKAEFRNPTIMDTGVVLLFRPEIVTRILSSKIRQIEDVKT